LAPLPGGAKRFDVRSPFPGLSGGQPGSA
jgi:hypothetical protein